MGSSRRKQHKHKGRHGETVFPPRAALIAHVSNFLKAVDMRVNHGLGNQHLMDASGTRSHPHAINPNWNTREGEIWLWIFPPRFLTSCRTFKSRGQVECFVPFGLDLLTKLQPRRDTRRNEKEKAQKMFDRKLSAASFLFSLHTYAYIYTFIFSLYFFAICYPGH